MAGTGGSGVVLSGCGACYASTTLGCGIHQTGTVCPSDCQTPPLLPPCTSFLMSDAPSWLVGFCCDKPGETTTYLTCAAWEAWDGANNACMPFCSFYSQHAAECPGKQPYDCGYAPTKYQPGPAAKPPGSWGCALQGGYADGLLYCCNKIGG